MLPTSCATLTVPKSTLQTSTASKDNSLYAQRPLAPASSTQCLPPPPSTHQPNHLTKPCSSYPHVTTTHQLQLHSHPTQSKPPSSCNPTSMPLYSEASPMASCKPSPVRKPAPASPTGGTKTDSAALSSTSSTTRTLSTRPQLVTPSIMAKSQTSTSQWVMGSIKRPSGFDLMMMGPSQVTTALRGPTSDPTSSTYMQHLTTVSIPPLRHFHPSSDTCLPVLVGTSRSYSKLWLTWMIGAWPARSRVIANLMTTSQHW
jgi:hypothetical protein